MSMPPLVAFWLTALEHCATVLSAMRHSLIDRPDFQYSGGRAPIYPYDQILATLGTSRAVLIPFDGKRIEQIVSSAGKTVRRKGIRFRHRKEKSGVAVWVERKGAA